MCVDVAWLQRVSMGKRLVHRSTHPRATVLCPGGGAAVWHAIDGAHYLGGVVQAVRMRQPLYGCSRRVHPPLECRVLCDRSPCAH
jgi:hypothetical protein